MKKHVIKLKILIEYVNRHVLFVPTGRYNSDILKLRWSDASYEIIDNDDLDALLSESLPSLNVNTTYDTSYCEVNVANRGKFSCLRYGITFCR